MTIGRMAAMQNAYRNLYANQTQTSRYMRNLSSGYRINSAADDAAGLAISEKMRSQIRGLDKATQNATNAVSLVQTAEGGLSSTTSVLQRMRELAVQASNGTYSDEDRALLNNEFQQLQGQLNQTASSTHYNGINLLDGSLADSGLTFQIGANGSADQRVSMSIGDMSGAGLGLDGIGIAGIDAANGAINAIDAAQKTVSSQRSSLGSMQNRLEHSINNLGVTSENMYASESRIRDADMAWEVMNYTQKSIMAQASQAMLAQSMNLSRSYMLGLLLR